MLNKSEIETIELAMLEKTLEKRKELNKCIRNLQLTQQEKINRIIKELLEINNIIIKLEKNKDFN
jgi:hypothetical protein